MKRNFAKNAIILCCLMMISKAIGALFRLPLTWIVGAEGLGLYQIVFPVYTLILTLTSAYIPQTLSRLVAENNAKNNFSRSQQLYIIANILVLLLSIIGAVLISIFARNIAGLQGNYGAKVCYFAIAPAIIFVGAISTLRGYFQGCEMMIPTGVVSLIEQAIKAVAGLILAKAFIVWGVVWGVFGALLGITISEIVAFIYLYVSYFITRRKTKFKVSRADVKPCLKLIASTCWPIALSGLIMPLVAFIDSALVVNLLSRTLETSEATAQFGLSSGIIGSLINLPVVLSLSVAMAVLPRLTSCNVKQNVAEVKRTVTSALFITLTLTLPCALGFVFLSKNIIILLYGNSLTSSHIVLASTLLRVGAVSVIFLAATQVLSSVLQGLGRLIIPLVALVFPGLVKIAVNYFLIPTAAFGILGDQVANIACYVVATVINLCFAVRFINKSILIDLLKLILAGSAMCGIVSVILGVSGLSNIIEIGLSVVGAAVVYFGILAMLYRKQLILFINNRKGKQIM